MNYHEYIFYFLKEIFLYKQYYNEKWELDEIKKVSSPIFGLKHADVTGDGVKELVVFSMKGVHIFQVNIFLVTI